MSRSALRDSGPLPALGSGWHLARRFFGSLRPGPPAATDERWARDQLLPGELGIWEQLSNPDRRHAVTVARAVAGQLGPEVGRPVLAAALLHDSGKVVSGLRTPARVAATIVWAVVDRGKATGWERDGGTVRRKLAEYRRHPEWGARLLADADADPLTIAWAAEHHLQPERWTVPVAIGNVLKVCDDD